VDSDLKLHQLGAVELVQRQRDDQLSALQLMDYFLARIAGLDNLETGRPGLNSVRELNPNARNDAAQRDQARLSGEVLGSLHGLPILLKDNIAVVGMACSAGSLALADLYPTTDATIATKLVAAGAVILGKANLTEFADYLGGEMPAEFSSAGGVVKHPYGKRYERGGGSSIGPACATAVGLCVAAVGSETQNSLQTPAGDSSVVSIKPTVGLVSRAGIMPLATSQDTAGPIGRTVADAAALLGPMAGVDLSDSITLTGAGHGCVDYGQLLDSNSLQGARIGVPRHIYFGRDGYEQREAVVETAIKALRAAGATIVDPADIPVADELAELRSTVFPTEFKIGVNHFLESYGDCSAMDSLADIIEFNSAHEASCLQYGQNLAINAEATAGPDLSSYQADRLQDTTLSREQGLDAALEAHHLDALITLAGAAAKVTGKAGYPVVTVPAGYTETGAPVGLSFIGSAWQESRLIALAYAFEQTGDYRRQPQLDQVD